MWRSVIPQPQASKPLGLEDRSNTALESIAVIKGCAMPELCDSASELAISPQLAQLGGRQVDLASRNGVATDVFIRVVCLDHRS